MAGVFRMLLRKTFVFVFAAIGLAVLVLLVTKLGWSEPAVATWYGPGFEGNWTASGEQFRVRDHTTAHKTLPFGEKLVVRYGGRSVVVRVNDRGPYSGADFDLSQGAAEALGMTSSGRATVEVVDEGPGTPADPGAAAPAAPSQNVSPGVPSGGAGPVYGGGSGYDPFFEGQYGDYLGEEILLHEDQ